MLKLSQGKVMLTSLSELKAIPNKLQYTVFGYIPRYSEYKFHNSSVSGDMRDTLEHWQLARKWENDDIPALNEEFVEAKPDKRIFAVIDEELHSIYAQVFHNVKAVRRSDLAIVGEGSVVDIDSSEYCADHSIIGKGTTWSLNIDFMGSKDIDDPTAIIFKH